MAALLKSALQRLARQSARMGDYSIVRARREHLSEIPNIELAAARLLCGQVCEWAASAGYDSVTLTTFRDVPWNGPFYERLGFRVVAGAELSAALRAIAEDETRRGLDPSRRVAMERPCGPVLDMTDEGAPEDLRFLEEHINEFNFNDRDSGTIQ